MRKIGLLLGVAVASVAAALTYHLFETAVHYSTHQVWEVWFNSNNERWLVIPLCLLIGLSYFGAVHYLDPKSENEQSHGLGAIPPATLINFIKVLFIGFLSLLAGATLGPEAILVPACLIIGTWLGAKFFGPSSQNTKILASAAFIALFAAFFDSFIIGVLALFIVTGQAKIKLRPVLLIIAGLASALSVLTLKVVDRGALAELPSYSWELNLPTVLASTILFVGGAAGVWLMSLSINSFKTLLKGLKSWPWWWHGLAASSGLAIFYLLGGPLVQFTGNQAIMPMYSDATSIGWTGLLWLGLIKIVAVAWSNSSGYRGGMIFPTLFIAATLSAIFGLYVSDLNQVYGIIAVMAGALVMNSKTSTLF